MDKTMSLSQTLTMREPSTASKPTSQSAPWQWKHYVCIDSTNREAERLIYSGSFGLSYTSRENPCVSLVVSADEQTHGRGRLNREWVSEASQGMYASFVVTMSHEFYEAYGSWLSTCAGLSAIYALRDVCNLPVQLKWPNDLYIDGKKLGGILCQMCVLSNVNDYSSGQSFDRSHASNSENERIAVIMGIGINISSSPKLNSSSDESDNPYSATSIAENVRESASGVHEQGDRHSQLIDSAAIARELIVSIAAHIDELLKSLKLPTSQVGAIDSLYSADSAKSTSIRPVAPQNSALTSSVSQNVAIQNSSQEIDSSQCLPSISRIRAEAVAYSCTLGKRVKVEFAQNLSQLTAQSKPQPTAQQKAQESLQTIPQKQQASLDSSHFSDSSRILDSSQILDESRILYATAIDIAQDASLEILPDNSSTTLRVTAGDVTHLR
ncbi:hypothetical protein EJ419_06605 [Alloscardovia theropitheci]|uniref:BPL/LPL catalytic domain-containing protein n=1 Tax=Alloscardovia theropitheci TaxID=2496842 RepID=A0A4R0QN81_9BIFI|nr:biotin--[acetyl-CoA-carboxylase] ligase [Alloscardovia theropitheci]TCD53642.1 hypothetical protein EJ419_06605 [Alloscardovia theropitheci]